MALDSDPDEPDALVPRKRLPDGLAELVVVTFASAGALLLIAVAVGLVLGVVHVHIS
jgi:hypothetical protein